MKIRLLHSKFLSLFMIFFLTFTLLSLTTSSVKAESENHLSQVDIPKIQFVTLEHSPFISGHSNSIYISSKDYSNNVQYQLFYARADKTNDSWKLINPSANGGWSAEVDPTIPKLISISNLKLKTGKYKIAIRVKRANLKNSNEYKYKNPYGNYDDHYIYNINVLSKSNKNLNGRMIINKLEFNQGEHIIVGGINNTSKNLYKIHLYNPAKDEWISPSKPYSRIVNCNTSNIPAGTYLLDLWCKGDHSKNKYDGVKFAVITIKEWTKEQTKNDNKVERTQSKLQTDLYNYLRYDTNRQAVNKRALSLNNGSAYNDCVYFTSEALRRVGVNVADKVCNTGSLINDKYKNVSLINYLSKNNWQVCYDVSKLLPGDICFTTTAKGTKGKPTHVYIFMGWVNEGSTDYAYICDNQSHYYGNQICHIRNIKHALPNKEALAFFMYKPTK